MSVLSPRSEGAPGREGLAREELIRDLVWLTAAGALVRVCVLLLTVTLKGDSAGLISMATDIADGRWDRVPPVEQHPLFSIVLAGVHLFVSDWLAAAQIVSLATSACTVPAIYLFGRKIGGRRIGIIAGGMAALQPELAQYAGSALTEAPYFLFYATTLWLGARLSKGPTIWGAVLAGVSSGMGYLCRPEGAIVVPFLFWAACAGMRATGRGWREMLRIWCAIAAGVIVSSGPYAMLLSWHHGYPTFSNKKGKELLAELRFREGTLDPGVPEPRLRDAREVARRTAALLARLTTESGPVELPLSLGDPHGAAAPNRNIQTQRDTYLRVDGDERSRASLAWKVARAFEPILLVFFGIGVAIALRRRGTIRDCGWIWALMIAYGVAVYWNNVTSFYVSKRHALAVIFAAFPWAAMGFLRVAEWIDRIRPRFSRSASAGWFFRMEGGAILATVLAAAFLPQVLSPQGRTSIDRKRIGEFLHDHGAAGTVLMTADGKVSLYARAQYMGVPQSGGYQELVGFLIAYEIPYLMIERGEEFKIERLVSAGWLVELDPLRGSPWKDRSRLRSYRVLLPRV